MNAACFRRIGERPKRILHLKTSQWDVFSLSCVSFLGNSALCAG